MFKVSLLSALSSDQTEDQTSSFLAAVSISISQNCLDSSFWACVLITPSASFQQKPEQNEGKEQEKVNPSSQLTAYRVIERHDIFTGTRQGCWIAFVFT